MADTDIIEESGSLEVEESNIDSITKTAEYKHKIKILRNAYQKLDNLPLSFGLPAYDDDMSDELVEKYFKIDLSDTLRETGLKMENIDEDSNDEMMVEDRTVYHALKRFRMSASVFFKFSTAVDGKTVDKTKIPQFIKELLDDLEAEYKSWRLGHVGSIWQRSSVLSSSSSS